MEEEEKDKEELDMLEDVNENRKKFQEHLQKTWSEMSQREKNDLGKDLQLILNEERARMNQLLDNFRKVSEMLARHPEEAQEEFNRQAKKLS